jgi:5-methylcytosine-specific restriction protein B
MKNEAKNNHAQVFYEEDNRIYLQPDVKDFIIEEYNKYNSKQFKGTINNTQENISLQTHPLNQILYGPPGTGKTYNTINSAIEIIENRVVSSDEDRVKLKQKFEELKEAGQIEFITFHQSYGYEEFVQGIKAKTVNNNITYNIEDGIFKKLCEKAQKNYENSQKSFEEIKKELTIYEKINNFLNESLENNTEFTKTKGGTFKIKDIEENSIIIFSKDSNYNENILELNLNELYKVLETIIDIKHHDNLQKRFLEFQIKDKKILIILQYIKNLKLLRLIKKYKK